ncbi:hypothetical protein Pmar_PMAR009740, partial [Perkinsus marinus ATCC 50983]
EYITEAKMLSEYDGYDEHGIAEMPLKEVGTPIWRRIAQHVERIRSQAAQEGE